MEAIYVQADVRPVPVPRLSTNGPADGPKREESPFDYTATF